MNYVIGFKPKHFLCEDVVWKEGLIRMTIREILDDGSMSKTSYTFTAHDRFPQPQTRLITCIDGLMREARRFRNEWIPRDEGWSWTWDGNLEAGSRHEEFADVVRYSFGGASLEITIP